MTHVYVFLASSIHPHHTWLLTKPYTLVGQYYAQFLPDTTPPPPQRLQNFAGKPLNNQNLNLDKRIASLTLRQSLAFRFARWCRSPFGCVPEYEPAPESQAYLWNLVINNLNLPPFVRLFCPLLTIRSPLYSLLCTRIIELLDPRSFTTPCD